MLFLKILFSSKTENVISGTNNSYVAQIQRKKETFFSSLSNGNSLLINQSEASYGARHWLRNEQSVLKDRRVTRNVVPRGGVQP